MSGIKVTIESNDQLFASMMRGIAARGKSLRPAMASIGEQMLLSTEQRFADQRDPDGQPWAPLSKRYAKRKKGDKILTERGALRRINYRATDAGVAWGTNRIYGAIHQLGGTIKQEARTQRLLFQARGADGERTGGRFISRKDAGKKTEVVNGKRKQRQGTAVRFASIAARSFKMPARRYLGINQNDRVKITEILMRHLTN
jgi:phage virion morphogenesis protein